MPIVVAGFQEIANLFELVQESDADYVFPLVVRGVFLAIYIAGYALLVRRGHT